MISKSSICENEFGISSKHHSIQDHVTHFIAPESSCM